MNFRSRDRTTTRTYRTTDSTNRIVLVEQAEGRWNGHVDVPDSNLPISAVIRLKDSDQSINVLDHLGYRVDIGWGFNTSSGDRYSEGPPVYVIEQRSFSIEGDLFVEFYCMSQWDTLRLAWSKQTPTAIIKYDLDVTVLHILMELLGGTSFKTLDSAGAEVLTGAVIQDDGGTPTDLTDAATNPTDGSDLGSTDDIALLPATGTIAVGDAVYIGHTDQFEHISIDLTTVGSGYSGVWEYRNASVFTTLTVVDNTETGSGNAFHAGQLKTISFTKPTNWTASTEHSLGPYFYVRFRVTGVGTTVQPKATKISVHHEFSVALDSATADQGDDYKPKYESDLNQNIITTVVDILAHTILVVRSENDGFHVFARDQSPSPIDYTYDTDHAFWVGVFSQSHILPNQIIATNLAPGDPGTRLVATANSAASRAAWGTWTQIVIDRGILDASDASSRASHALTRSLRNLPQGQLEVPMNVGQEVWDVARVIDGRSGQTYDSIISQVVRLYNPGEGIYLLRLNMGGAEIAVEPPDSSFPTTGAAVSGPGVGPLAGQAIPSQVTPQGVEFVRVDPIARVPDIGPSPGRSFIQRDSEGVFDPLTGLGGGAAGGFSGRPKLVQTIKGRIWDTSFWGLFPTQSPQIARRQIAPATGGFLSNTSELLIERIFVNFLNVRDANFITLEASVIPDVSGGPQLGSDAKRMDSGYWGTLYSINVWPVDGSGTGSVGFSSAYWQNGYFEDFRVNILRARTGTSIEFSDDLIPDGNQLYDLGSLSPPRFLNNVYSDLVIAALLVPKVAGTSDVGNEASYWDSGWFDNLRVDTLKARTSNTPIIIEKATGEPTHFLRLRHPDIAHGMTDQLPTDHVAAFITNSSLGGLEIRALKEPNSLQEVLALVGLGTVTQTNKDTGADGYIKIRAGKKSGTTVGSLGSNENILVVLDNQTTRFILDADGDSHQDVGTAWTNFDQHNDAVLLRDFAQAVSQDKIRAGFSRFLAYNQEQLEELGLVSFEGPTPFVNMSRLTMLHTGAIWQLHSRIESLEQELKALQGGPNG